MDETQQAVLMAELKKWRARAEYWESMYLDLAQHTQRKELVNQIMDYPKAAPDETD